MATDHQSTTVLVLFAHTDAGHRHTAEAVIEALAATSSRYRPVLCDPLTGPSTAGRSVHGSRGMLRELAPEREGPAALAAMRDAFHALARPAAPAEIAELIAGPGRPETLNSGVLR